MDGELSMNVLIIAGGIVGTSCAYRRASKMKILTLGFASERDH